MKFIPLILILSLSPVRAQNWEPVKAIGLFAGAVICEAMADGMYDNGNKIGAHMMGVAYTGMLLSAPLILKKDDNHIYGVGSYISFRVALFDPMYNITRGIPAEYIGNTSMWDKGLQRIDPNFLLFSRYIMFLIGIRLTFEL